MRPRRLVLLWVVAAALGVLYRIQERRVESIATVQEPQAERLVDVEEADVLGIRFVDGAVTMRIEPTARGWRVVDPADAAVPVDLVRAFVEAFFGAVVLDGVAPEETPSTAFGFDQDRRIEVDLGDASQLVFVLGGQTPTGTSAYVRDGRRGVRVIGRNALVYRDLLLDAVRASPPADPPTGPVARRALTQMGGPG